MPRYPLWVGLSLTLSIASTAYAAPTVTITKPSSGALSTGSLDVTATVSSPYAVSTVRATVETASGDLSYSTGFSSWNGTINLSSLPSGTKTLLVTATDATGSSGSSSVTFKLGGPPPVSVAAPLPLSVARPSFNVAITCATCVTLTLATEGGVAIAAGTTGIVGTYTLPVNPASVTLVAKGTDSDGFVTTTKIPIYVEPSTELEEVITVPGEILEVDATRILFRDSGGALKVRDIASGADASTGLAGDGRLTPGGVVSGNTEWRPTGSVIWGFDGSGVGSAMNGNWAGRPILGGLRRRNLLTDSESDVPFFAGASCGGGSGKWLGPGGEAALSCESCLSSCSGSFRTYLFDGSTTVETSAYTGLGPPTGYSSNGSSFAVISASVSGASFSVYGPTCMPSAYGGVSLPSGYTGTDACTTPLNRPGRSVIQFNGGWTAYSLTGSGTSANDIWRCSTSSAPTKLSFFNGVTAIEALASNGDVMLYNTVKDWTGGAGKTQRYLATGSGVPRLISEHDGAQVGTPYFVGCDWKLAIGRTLFTVKSSGSSGCGTLDAGVDSGSLDAGDSGSDTGVDDAADATIVFDALPDDGADTDGVFDDAADSTVVADSDITTPDTDFDTSIIDTGETDTSADAVAEVGGDAADSTVVADTDIATPDTYVDAGAVDTAIGPVADASADSVPEVGGDLDASAAGEADAAVAPEIEEPGGICSYDPRPRSNWFAFAALALIALRRRTRLQ